LSLELLYAADWRYLSIQHADRPIGYQLGVEQIRRLMIFVVVS
jgi:hypothetical protein